MILSRSWGNIFLLWSRMSLFHAIKWGIVVNVFKLGNNFIFSRWRKLWGFNIEVVVCFYFLSALAKGKMFLWRLCPNSVISWWRIVIRLEHFHSLWRSNHRSLFSGFEFVGWICCNIAIRFIIVKSFWLSERESLLSSRVIELWLINGFKRQVGTNTKILLHNFFCFILFDS